MGPDKSMQTHADLLNAATSRLIDAGSDTPKLDARLLLQHICGLEHAGLISRMGEALASKQADEFESLINQRITGRSVHRIIGYREFFGHRFELCSDTLEPRPDTECLVERVLADDHGPNPRFVDIGTGSGAIAISLLKALPDARAVASDISAGALNMAKSNARALGVEGRIELLQCSYLDDLAGQFDFLVSNPPYITTETIKSLESQVRDYDPMIALDGGADGLDAYREILKFARSVVKPGGKLYFEIGYDQSEELKMLSFEYGLECIDVVQDLAGQDRAVVLIYK